MAFDHRLKYLLLLVGSRRPFAIGIVIGGLPPHLHPSLACLCLDHLVQRKLA
jgi:hypothetical protein